MDHLTWLMLLQEADETGAWPAFPAERGPGGRDAADLAAAVPAATEELASAWQQMAAWEQAAERHRSAREETAFREAEAGTVMTVPYAGFWRRDAEGRELPAPGGFDMEEISRFFERDARRF